MFFPTASTVAVFLNGLHVDLAYSFNFQESAPKIPIYGYNDYEFSKVIRGKQLVQGVLVLNFTDPSYLQSVMDQDTGSYIPRLFNYDLTYKTRIEKKSYKDSVKASLMTELPANTDANSKAARAEYIANLLSPKNKQNKALTTQALYEFFEPIVPGEDKKSSSIVASDLVDTRSNQLDVYYHDPNLINWLVRFNDVHFTEESQQISQAGAEGSSEPLYLIYQFIAKNKQIIRIR